MTTQRQAPIALKLIAVLFIISGISCALEVLVSLARNHINLNFGVLGIFIGLGLLRFRRGWRTCALVFTWLALIFIPVFALLVLGGAHPIHLKLFGQRVGNASPDATLFFAVAAFAVVVWQYRVLTRRNVVQLFNDQAEPAAAPNGGPATPAGSSGVSEGELNCSTASHVHRLVTPLFLVVGLILLAFLWLPQWDAVRRWRISHQQPLASNLSVRVEDLYLFPTNKGDLLRVRFRFLRSGATNAQIGLVAVGSSGSQELDHKHWWFSAPQDSKGGESMILEFRDRPAYQKGFFVRFYEAGRTADATSPHTDVRVRYLPRRTPNGEMPAA